MNSQGLNAGYIAAVVAKSAVIGVQLDPEFSQFCFFFLLWLLRGTKLRILWCLFPFAAMQLPCDVLFPFTTVQLPYVYNILSLAFELRGKQRPSPCTRSKEQKIVAVNILSFYPCILISIITKVLSSSSFLFTLRS